MRRCRAGVDTRTLFNALENVSSSSNSWVRAPIIAYADYTQRFIISTDANECGLGALLDQEQDGLEQVFGNASRSFHPSARNDANYSFWKLELVTMKRAVVEKMVGTTKNGHKNVEMRKMHHRLLKSIHHSLWNMNASAVFAVVRIIEGISLVHFWFFLQIKQIKQLVVAVFSDHACCCNQPKW